VGQPVEPVEPVGPVDDPVARLEADLRDERAGRPGPLARSVRVARGAVLALVAVVVATGVAAFVVGVVATRGSLLGIAVMALLCAPAILAPLSVARRAAPLAQAAAHPSQLADQALDLVHRSRSSPAVAALARQAVTQARTGSRRGRRGPGLRGSVALARSAGAVVDQAGPDPTRYRLLLAFRPGQLRRLWLGVIVSLWAWFIAVAAGVSAFVVLVVDRI
jgi:hypothetical protein